LTPIKDRQNTQASTELLATGKWAISAVYTNYFFATRSKERTFAYCWICYWSCAYPQPRSKISLFLL